MSQDTMLVLYNVWKNQEVIRVCRTKTELTFCWRERLVEEKKS